MAVEEQEMRVLKRNGKYETIAFDKILKRVKTIGSECNITLNYTAFVMKIIDQLYDGIPTAKIDELAAEHSASLSTHHFDYGTLASHIIMSNHHKNTHSSFFSVMKKLYNFRDVHGAHYPLIEKEYWNTVQENKQEFDSMIVHDRDYLIDYFGFKTLERSYLMKVNNVIVERPQYMWLRVAIGIHKNDLEKVKTTYDLMSQKYFTHATPTLFNAGTPTPQLSSCYLIAMENDSIDGIYSTLRDCAKISKWAGGIGMHIHNVRASGSFIRGTNGSSNGIVPMLRVFNNTARYVDQCVTPETYIYTTDGPAQIQNLLQDKSETYNKTGSHELIENILEHPYEGEVYEIENMHSIDNLVITPEHPILVLPDQQKMINYKTITNRLDKKIVDFKWRDAKDLTKNDMLVYTIPSYEKDSTLTSDDCYFYGITLADGYVSDTLCGHITLHTINKRNILNFITEYLDKHVIQYTVTVNDNTTRLRWNKTINLPFKHSDIYDSNKEKHVVSRFLNLPIEKSIHIVKGLVECDGCIDKEIVFDSTSRQMIESVRYLLLKKGILTSGYTRDRIGESHNTYRGDIITTRKISYSLRIPRVPEICSLFNIDNKVGEFYNFFRYGNYLCSRIKNISTRQYSGTLYDLQLTKEHNYMIHNGIIHNGGGRRSGSFAIYLEPWHADIEDFLELRKNHGDEDMRARDLFYALWTPDLFMERVKTNDKWSLFCPDECPGLHNVYGAEFKELYEKYENGGKYKRQINARDLWLKVMDSQMETGTPYILYKDAANEKSNQKNLGTIMSSNLCTEIMEYSDKDETAVCNLGSIALSNFVENRIFNYDKLHEVTKILTDNLNKVIDINFYPTEKTKRSNMRHRPIGIGVQGLADTFALMNMPFHSEAAKNVNKLIFETIYHAALECSNEIAKSRSELLEPLALHDDFSDKLSIDEHVKLQKMINEHETPNLHHTWRGAYSTFHGSPTSNGILQYDMWNVEPSDRYDWATLKESIKTYGIRNSLLVAPMPTASTSQILGNNECFEPFTSNIYTRRTLAGEFIIVNKYLMRELLDLKLWNEKVKNNIIANKGSVQYVDGIPDEIKEKYKIVWEIPMKHLIDMAKDRGAFICQSQSLNLWLEEPKYNTLTSMHFYSWQAGLKTGIYYLRRMAKHQAQQFTIEPDKKKSSEDPSDDEDEICEMCSA